MTDRPKLLILGYGRHGKDTVAEFLQDDYGFKFTSSSLFVAQEVMWDNWGVARYDDFDAMFDDRSNHRVLWMEMISAYNTPDKTKTATTMLERGFDLYVGMRRLDELDACRDANIFDAIIWVDASERHPPETGSMDITLHNSGADFVIDNNGPEEAIVDEISRLMKWLDGQGLGIWKKETGADDVAIRGALARGYCHDVNSHKTLDPDLIEAQLQELRKIMEGQVKEEPTFIEIIRNMPPLFENLFSEDFDGGSIDPEPTLFGTAGPEAVAPVFKSTRSTVGALQETTTTVEGATTIINIENFYSVGGDD